MHSIVKIETDVIRANMLKKIGSTNIATYQMGQCRILYSLDQNIEHVSIKRPDRYPNWPEIKAVRNALMANNTNVAMYLPPKDQFVNIDQNTFHLFETDEPFDLIRDIMQCADSNKEHSNKIGKCSILYGIYENKRFIRLENKDKFPIWEDIKKARYELMPPDINAAIFFFPNKLGENLNKKVFYIIETKPDSIYKETR